MCFPRFHCVLAIPASQDYIGGYRDGIDVGKLALRWANLFAYGCWLLWCGTYFGLAVCRVVRGSCPALPPL